MRSLDSDPGGVGLSPRRPGRWAALVACVAALSAVLFLSACGGGSSSSSGSSTSSGGSTSSTEGETEPAGEEVTYGVSLPYAEVPVIASMKSLIQNNAQAAGWEVLLDQTKAGSIQEQTATIENWITQGVTAITIFPPEPSAFEAIAKRAVEAGIIWTTYAEPMKEGAGGVTFPAELSGTLTGEAAVKWINANDPEAEVLVLNAEGVPAEEERTTIPEKMIEEETKATIVASQFGTEETKGLQVTEDILQSHPGISVVVAENDDGALGATEAFRKGSELKPEEVFIIGQDGSEEALKALEDPNSYFRASAALDLGELGKETFEVTKRAIEKGWEPGDKQEILPLAPVLVENGETAKAKELLKAFE
jgi:ABC-type sugar transport system substrate-binding protein